MNTNSNKYIFVYSIIMVVVVAFVLAFVATQLKPRQQKNVEIEKKRNILSSIHIESTSENAEELFKQFIIEMIAVNIAGEKVDGVNVFNIDFKKEMEKPDKERQLPVYIAKTADGDTIYVVPLVGKGLWGPIMGYIALKSDFNTVYGAVFSHKSETPGLGAEISTPQYQAQFPGKQIYDENGNFVSVKVVKGGVPKTDLHAVDAVSGGTITSNGLSDMLSNCLMLYNAYFKNK